MTALERDGAPSGGTIGGTDGPADDGEVPGIRTSWLGSDRRLPSSVVRPALRLAEVDAAGGVVMLVAAVAALLWANSPWRHGYERLLETPFTFAIGRAISLDLNLHGVINDGLMTLFFVIAGLEIKRQLVSGELRDRRAAALPAFAALGGMLVPAVLYLAINAGHAGHGGWGVPVATDIAFAVGIVTLAGDRVSVGQRIFILTLAVVDDVGGIVVIAVFYSTDVRLRWLAVAAGSVALALAVQRLDIRSPAPYLVLGCACWYGLHQAGVEAAIAGVVFGLLTPAEAFHDRSYRRQAAGWLLDRLDADETTVDDVARYLLETEAPLTRLEQRLNLWVAFGVVPLFALANAGVRLDLSGVDRRVVLGVAGGLVVGKAIGVFSGAWLAVRCGLGRLPAGATWAQVFGLAVTAGIGFTVALYVAGLSFDDVALTSSAKIGIIAGSIVAGLAGFALLRRSGEVPTRR